MSPGGPRCGCVSDTASSLPAASTAPWPALLLPVSSQPSSGKWAKLFSSPDHFLDLGVGQHGAMVHDHNLGHYGQSLWKFRGVGQWAAAPDAVRDRRLPLQRGLLEP